MCCAAPKTTSGAVPRCIKHADRTLCTPADGFGQEHDIVKQCLGSLGLNYSLPSLNFNRSKVKGLVISLISLDAVHYKSTDDKRSGQIMAGS
jgi:hypothetical protein